jgi:hypothetical protein
MGMREVGMEFWWGKLREKDHWGDPGVDGKIILRLMYIKCEMGGACRADGDERGVYRVLVGKPEGKRPLGRPRRRWEDNIKINVYKV